MSCQSICQECYKVCERQILEKSRNCFDDLKFEEYLGTKFWDGYDCIEKNETLHREELMSNVFYSGNMDSVFAEDDKKGSEYFRLKREKMIFEE